MSRVCFIGQRVWKMEHIGDAPVDFARLTGLIC
jgi:hypothetical protein